MVKPGRLLKRVLPRPARSRSAVVELVRQPTIGVALATYAAVGSAQKTRPAVSGLITHRSPRGAQLGLPRPAHKRDQGGEIPAACAVGAGDRRGQLDAAGLAKSRQHAPVLSRDGGKRQRRVFRHAPFACSVFVRNSPYSRHDEGASGPSPIDLLQVIDCPMSSMRPLQSLDVWPAWVELRTPPLHSAVMFPPTKSPRPSIGYTFRVRPSAERTGSR